MKRSLLCLAFGATAVAATAWVHQSSNLYIGGSLASSGVFMHNGVACVPIRDVATALKLTVQKSGRGLELTDAGGANQASGIAGKIGETLWNGYTRFEVVKLIRGKAYTNQFSGDNQKITPNVDADDLVVLVCRIKNGLKNGITVEYPGGETALTDTDGHSYPPRLGMSADIASRGVDLLPGAAMDFALTFDVPSSCEIGDVVYQESLAGSGTNGSEKKKFRVSLKQ
jgi:hypothetical protein